MPCADSNGAKYSIWRTALKLKKKGEQYHVVEHLLSENYFSEIQVRLAANLLPALINIIKCLI